MALMLDYSTELDTVNKMLGSIGQTPVNTLEVTGIGDVATARRYLTDTLRDVQAVGWSWNTDRNYTLSPDTRGYIAVPSGALDVDAEDKTISIVVRRNPVTGAMSLWDGDNKTFVFSSAVDVQIIWGYNYNDLPQTARTYIGTLAARRFQGQVVSSPILDRVNQAEVDSAWLLLMRGERKTRDTNVYRANRTVGSFANRRRF